MIGHKLRAVLAAGAMGIFLCACEQEADTTEETTLKIEQDGTIENTIVENFDETLYSVDNLQNMILEEVSFFNSTAGGNGVSMKKVELSEEGDKVNVVMTYASAAMYESFNEEMFFYGSAQELAAAGIDWAGTGLQSQKGDAYGMEDVLKKEGNKFIVIGKSKKAGSVKIEVPSKILYVSDNVEFVSGKSARILADTEDLAYIVIKE